MGVVVGESRENEVGLARSLGRFFGHVLRGARADVRRGEEREVRVVRREVEEGEVETGRGVVTVRRTVIEEIEAPARGKDES